MCRTSPPPLGQFQFHFQIPVAVGLCQGARLKKKTMLQYDAEMESAVNAEVASDSSEGEEGGALMEEVRRACVAFQEAVSREVGEVGEVGENQLKRNDGGKDTEDDKKHECLMVKWMRHRLVERLGDRGGVNALLETPRDVLRQHMPAEDLHDWHAILRDLAHEFGAGYSWLRTEHTRGFSDTSSALCPWSATEVAEECEALWTRLDSGPVRHDLASLSCA